MLFFSLFFFCLIDVFFFVVICFVRVQFFLSCKFNDSNVCFWTAFFFFLLAFNSFIYLIALAAMLYVSVVFVLLILLEKKTFVHVLDRLSALISVMFITVIVKTSFLFLSFFVRFFVVIILIAECMVHSDDLLVNKATMNLLMGPKRLCSIFLPYVIIQINNHSNCTWCAECIELRSIRSVLFDFLVLIYLFFSFGFISVNGLTSPQRLMIIGI